MHSVNTPWPSWPVLRHFLSVLPSSKGKKPRTKTQHRAISVLGRCASGFILCLLFGSLLWDDMCSCPGEVHENSSICSIWGITFLVIAALLSSPCFLMFSQAPASSSQSKHKEGLREYFLRHSNSKSSLAKRGFVGQINFGRVPYSIFESQDVH